jgi:Fe-S-cluster containining protein
MTDGVRALRVIQERTEATSSRVRDEVAALLRADPSPAGQIRAAHHAQAALDAEGDRVRARGLVPACSPGCASCCHVHVDATAPEILAVAAHLRATLSEEALAALRDRLAAHDGHVRDLSDEARWEARIPCALLGDDGRCTVYPARPLRCRAFHSTSAEVCRRALAGWREVAPPTLPALDRVHDAVEDGYDRALAVAEVSPGTTRLESGLLAALGDELGPFGATRA